MSKIIKIIAITIISIILIASFNICNAIDLDLAENNSSNNTSTNNTNSTVDDAEEENNTATGNFNMVYRRKDGNIGWVEPK